MSSYSLFLFNQIIVDDIKKQTAMERWSPIKILLLRCFMLFYVCTLYLIIGILVDFTFIIKSHNRIY